MTNALAVVAHFDDAILWAGGAIRKTRARAWEWTIVCTCAAEQNRREYFLESCDALGARGVALAFVDHPEGGPFSRNGRTALVEAVRAATDATPFEWVLTHNLDTEGEYGLHPNHTETAHAVAGLVATGMIRPAVVQFAYRKLDPSVGSSVVARATAAYLIQLDYDDLAWKAEWCARARDVELQDPALGRVSWLERLGWPCPNPEAFSAERLLPAPFISR